MSNLVMATEGVCAGHLCDNCATCRHGRCCKRDHEGYHLPDEGDWDGPIFGKIGIYNDDGSKAECHCCGEWFRSVGHHIAKHELTADEYRAIFGLRSDTALENEYLREQHRERAIRDNYGNTHMDQMEFTPEQRAEFTRRAVIRRRSTQYRNDPQRQEFYRKFVEKSRAPEVRERARASYRKRLEDPAEKERIRSLIPQWQKRAETVEVTCVICGATSMRKKSVVRSNDSKQQICGNPACKAEFMRQRIVAGDDPLRKPESIEKMKRALKDFKRTPARAKQWSEQRKGSLIACAICGKEFIFKVSEQQKGIERRYCSRECAAEAFAKRDTCKNGHPRTPENTYRYPDGKLLCKACQREYTARWEAKRGK